MITISEKGFANYVEDGLMKSLRLVFTNLNIEYTNDHILNDSFYLTESISSEDNLFWIGCIASSIEMTILDIDSQIINEPVSLYCSIDNDDEIPLFHGFIESSNITQEGFLQIRAYDFLYTMSKTDVSTWYNNHNQTTLETLLKELFEYLNFPYKLNTLINGKLPCYCALSQVAESLSALDLLKSICQLNATIGKINRYGVFENIDVDKTTPVLTTNSQTSLVVEKYNTKTIGQVLLREASGDGGTYYGEGDNKYIIEGNMFSFDLSQTQKNTCVLNIYNKISGLSFTPFSSKNAGFPFLECGDTISFFDNTGVKVTSIILNRTLINVNRMTDEYITVGNETYDDVISSINTNLTSLKAQMGEYSRIAFKYANVRELSINDGEEEVIGDVKITTTLNTPTYLSEVMLSVVPNKKIVERTVLINGSEMTLQEEVNESVTIGFKYFLNGEIIDYYPSQTVYEGKHIISLIYYLSKIIDAATFRTFVTVTGGNITIAPFEARLGIIGQGKEAAGVTWDGTITIEEIISIVNREILRNVMGVTVNVLIETQIPMPVKFYENIPYINRLVNRNIVSFSVNGPLIENEVSI